MFLNSRKAVCLLNPWHPAGYGDPQFEPDYPHDGYISNGTFPYDATYLKWGMYSKNELKFYRSSDGSWFPDGNPTIIKKAKSKNNTYIYIVLSGAATQQYWGTNRFGIFGIYPNQGPGGYYGSRFPGSFQSSQGGDPPWDTTKLYTPVNEIHLYTYAGKYNNLYLWEKFVQNVTNEGIFDQYTVEEWQTDKDWKPDPAIFKEWKRNVGTPQEVTLYFGEVGEDILPNQLDKDGYTYNYGGSHLMARDAANDDTVEPYDLPSDLPDAAPFGDFLAFHPQEDAFTWYWYKQDYRWSVYAYVIDYCSDCPFEGLTYTIEAEYENGECYNTPQNPADFNGYPFGPNFSWESGDIQKETVSGKLDKDTLIQTSGSTKIYRLGTFDWILGESECRRLLDFAVVSIE